MRILVTGGAGYIGSHTCLELLKAGHDPVVVDNLKNSKRESIRRIEELTRKKVVFHEADLRDRPALDQIFKNHGIDSVLHFAGLKAVGESVHMPLGYYNNNLIGTIALCEAMEAHRVRSIVFSSSATVYGVPGKVPITEEFPLAATNPYGRTKLMIEDILRDIFAASPEWRIAILRYFNPVGAHESGRIGEDPQGVPNNLMPNISQVASGKLGELSVFGDDYPTPDGTGIRDYIHVVDLAIGHLKALEKLTGGPMLVTCNLGAGRGYSVLEMIAAFEKASGRKIAYKMAARRPGDVAVCYADPAKARQELGWSAKRGIGEMCADAWRWQSHNPDGY